MSLPRRAFWLFLLGFFLGTLGDLFHVLSGTTAYPPLVFRFYFYRQPFWVPFLFGFATVAIGLSHPWLDRILRRKDRPWGSQNLPRAAVGLFLFLILYWMSGFLPLATGGAKDAVLAVGALLLWIFLDRSWQGFLVACLTGLLGTVSEINLVRFGAFSYLSPANNLWGVASWLPLLYFSASVTVGNFGRFLKEGRDRV